MRHICLNSQLLCMVKRPNMKQTEDASLSSADLSFKNYCFAAHIQSKMVGSLQKTLQRTNKQVWRLYRRTHAQSDQDRHPTQTSWKHCWSKPKSTSPRLWLSTNHRYAGMHHSTYAGALLVYSRQNVAEAIALRFLVNSHSTITFSSTACLQS